MTLEKTHDEEGGHGSPHRLKASRREPSWRELGSEPELPDEFLSTHDELTFTVLLRSLSRSPSSSLSAASYSRDTKRGDRSAVQ
jgi:hypothetical protein